MYSTPKGKQAGRASAISTRSSSRRAQSSRSSSRTSVATVNRSEEILEEGENFVVKSQNNPVPVQVQESLRANIKTAGVKLHESGWAWVVAGSKMLLWRYSALQTTKCYHVKLPASRTGWSVDLLTVTSASSESELSMMGCSPEGSVYWWSNILKSTAVSLKDSVDVGEGCVLSITNMPYTDTQCCLMATSLASLWVLNVSAVECRLSMHPLSVPRGMLSGIGHRVTSIFFGSEPTEVQELRRVAVGQSQNAAIAFVLTNSHLQKWRISRSSEEMFSDVSVVPLLKDMVLLADWVDVSVEFKVLVTDVQVCREHVVLLFATLLDPHAHYGIAIFPAMSDPSPSNIKPLIKIPTYRPIKTASALTEFTLHGISSSSSVLVLSKHTVFLLDVVEGSLVQAFSPAQSNMILGVGQYSDQLLLFTTSQGVIAVAHTSNVQKETVESTSRHTSTRPSASFLATPVSTRPAQTRTHRPSLPQVADNISEEHVAEATQLLQTGFFQLYLEGNIAGAMTLCDEHFPASSFSHGLDTLGDRAVILLSQRILDDPPPQMDPSFYEGQADIQGQNPVIIIYHLQQKVKAHDKYLHFLEDVGLLERVTSTLYHGSAVPTKRLLVGEHAELLQAAVTLRQQHNQVVDGVINLVMSKRPAFATLSRAHAFYTNVSMLEEFFPALVLHQKQAIQSLKDSQERVNMLVTGSSLLDSALKSVLLYRQSKGTVQDSPSPASDETQDYVPWTASDSMRSNITSQLDMVFDIGIAESQRDQDINTLWCNAISLMDTLFDGYRNQLRSQGGSKAEVRRQFQTQRSKYLNILYNSGRLPAVEELAEKYEDFATLVKISQGNTAKLKVYMNRFSAEGFSDFLFKKYLDEGNLKELLSFSSDFPKELGAFLEPHPSLNWLHCLATRNYSKGQSTLKQLAEQEIKCAGRRKTYLSLSKLSLLASRPSEETRTTQCDSINTLLRHIEIQEQLPSEVLEATGLDYHTMPPLSPQRIIELLVGDLHPSSEEKHFLIALDYLLSIAATMDKSTYDNLSAYIWSQAILKEDWTHMSADNIPAELRKTFFFRVCRQAFHQGLNVFRLLPDFNTLLASPSITQAGLCQNHTFIDCMRGAYEEIETFKANQHVH